MGRTKKTFLLYLPACVPKLPLRDESIRLIKSSHGLSHSTRRCHPFVCKLCQYPFIILVPVLFNVSSITSVLRKSSTLIPQPFPENEQKGFRTLLFRTLWAREITKSEQAPALLKRIKRREREEQAKLHLLCLSGPSRAQMYGDLVQSLGTMTTSAAIASADVITST